MNESSATSPTVLTNVVPDRTRGFAYVSAPRPRIVDEAHALAPPEDLFWDYFSQYSIDGLSDDDRATITDACYGLWRAGWTASATFPCAHYRDCPQCNPNVDYICSVCDLPTSFVSENQRYLAERGDDLHCGRCFGAQRDRERRDDAIAAASTLTSQIADEGTFPVAFNTGGFVYLLTDNAADPLYVGSTTRQLHQRPFEHKDKTWFREVAAVRYWFYDSMDAMATAERTLIAMHQPQHNTQHVGVRA